MVKKMLYFSCLCLFVASGVAKANTIGPSSCASCAGANYTLGYSGTANPDVFDVFLTVDTTGFNKANTDLLNAVSLKIVPKTSDMTSLALVSEPSSFGATVSGGLSANGCDGHGNGFFCSESGGKGVPVAHSGDIYTFEWALTLKSPNDLLTGEDAASFKVLYVTSAGKHNGITSEEITLTQIPPTPPPFTTTTPEPSSFLLLGTGIASLAGALRRRLFAKS